MLSEDELAGLAELKGYLAFCNPISRVKHVVVLCDGVDLDVSRERSGRWMYLVLRFGSRYNEPQFMALVMEVGAVLRWPALQQQKKKEGR